MRVSSSVKTALAIVAATAGYFTLRSVLKPGGADSKSVAATAAAQSVVALDVQPAARSGSLVVRGRTKADQKVVVRADASGVVVATPVALGERVRKGDALCRLDVEARDAARREADAALRKAAIDYDAAVALAAEGFRSEAGLAAIKAARDQARANADRAAIDLEKTIIRAPFDGIFDSRDADIGDLLKPGDPCGTVMKATPFLIVGAVAEKDVALVKAGDVASARLATGETLNGVVRFVAAAADPSTRSFELEIEVPNEEAKLRDGVTADVTVQGSPRDTHKAPRSALTLDDDGRLGVKVIDPDSRARFRPVSIVGEEPDGIWIAGLEGPARIIVRGQDYVRDGDPVTAARESGAP